MYLVVVDEEAQEQVAALPTSLLPHYAEALDIVTMAPWSGKPYNPDKPIGAMRHLLFGPQGRGEVIYLIAEDQQQVDVIRVYWL